MEQTQILCSNPRIILNPLAGEFITRFGFYYYNGHRVDISRNLGYHDSTLNKLRPRLKFPDYDYSFDEPGYDRLYRLKAKKVCNISDEAFNNSFFVDPQSGEVYPMYIKVRCGKCDNCKKSKVLSLVHRCKLETMCYKYRPLFLTLTYDEHHKPFDGVRLRDVQLFFKRFRITLERYGYPDKIRYLLVSEYGKNTHRPHYHAIIWNLHQSDIVSYKEIGEIIKKCWPNGFEMHRLIDPGNDKAFFYTAKYLAKDNLVPPGCKRNFMVCSNRGGAIGALFLAVIAPELRKSLNTEPFFLNIFNGKVEPLQFSKYILDKIFPSINKSITSVVRSSVKRYVLNCCMLRSMENQDPGIRELFQYEDNCRVVMDFFTRYMYIYHPDDVPWDKSLSVLLRELDQDELVIGRFMTSLSIRFDEDLLEIDRKRRLFLSKLVKKFTDIDLDKRARSWSNLVDYLSQYEIF